MWSNDHIILALRPYTLLWLYGHSLNVHLYGVGNMNNSGHAFNDVLYSLIDHILNAVHGQTTVSVNGVLA